MQEVDPRVNCALLAPRRSSGFVNRRGGFDSFKGLNLNETGKCKKLSESDSLQQIKKI